MTYFLANEINEIYIYIYSHVCLTNVAMNQDLGLPQSARSIWCVQFITGKMLIYM